MTIAAAVPWIQASEDVVAENEVNGHADVANRPAKFFITQSGIAEAGLFPGFLPAHNGAGTPEGVQTAPIGRVYVQSDAVAGAFPLWVKVSGVLATGWRKWFSPSAADTTGIMIGEGTTSAGINSVVLGDAITLPSTSPRSVLIGSGIIFASAGAFTNGVIVIGRAAEFTALTGTANASVLIGVNSVMRALTNVINNSIVVGSLSSSIQTTGVQNVAIFGCSSTETAGSGSTIIGCSSTSASQFSTILGFGSTVFGVSSESTLVGGLNQCTGQKNVIVGQVSTITGGKQQNVVVGYNSSTSQDGNVLLGAGTSSAFTSTILIGVGLASTAANQCWIGGSTFTSWIDTMIVGSGNTNNTPHNFLFRLTNVGVTADVAGNTFTIQSGLGTGIGAPSTFIVKTPDLGASGSGAQVASVKLTVGPTAAFTMNHTPGNANNSALVTMTGTIVEHTAGVHARFSLLELIVPTITAGAATLTDTAMLYIPGPMVGVTTGKNYSMWIAAGLSRIDGGLATDAVPIANFFLTGKGLIWNIITVVYSAAMTIDASTGPVQVISANNATAFTINAPTNPQTGAVLTITIRNTTAGALGVATWNAVFKMAAWVQPATATSRSIVFVYDATNWVERWRAGADVPN